jgi:hypothetical protein
MRIAIVNHMHPGTPHVSGMRAWYFARELAVRGHQVVQICERREAQDAGPEPRLLAERLRTHSWDTPLLLAVTPRPRRTLDWVRSAHTPVPVRKALVAWNYARHSGMFTDFSDGAQPYLPILAREFRPEAVWGIFGNTDCWIIAQRLANLAGCAWVADMKDSWEVSIRRGFDRILAARFGDMAAGTANAEFNATVLRRWFGQAPAIVYSGVDPCFAERAAAPAESGTFRITLTGSVRDITSLRGFVDAVVAFVRMRATARTMELVYAGGDAAKVRPALRPLEGLARLVVRDYIPLPELASLCQGAAANAYIWAPTGFHHKLLELLSCGRPIVAFPGETDESRRLSEATSGLLNVCRTPAEVHDALDRARLASARRPSIAPRFEEFSWAAQSRVLEGVFASLGCSGRAA